MSETGTATSVYGIDVACPAASTSATRGKNSQQSDGAEPNENRSPSMSSGNATTFSSVTSTCARWYVGVSTFSAGPVSIRDSASSWETTTSRQQPLSARQHTRSATP